MQLVYREKFPKVETGRVMKAKEPLEMVHTDLGGTIAPESFEGYKYAITFTDDFSGAIYVYFLRNKNKAVH